MICPLVVEVGEGAALAGAHLVKKKLGVLGAMLIMVDLDHVQ